MNEAATLPEPWPADGLESVPNCPICDDARRALLYTDLVDKVFRVAPGKWQLWRCVGCRSGYLDPRPTQSSIHIAYKNYFTHEHLVPSPREDYERLSAFRKLRRRLFNGYVNWRYSTQAQPSSALGIAAAYAAPSHKWTVDLRYRHIPRLPPEGGRLLDVGCGSGAFLRLAQTCGWEVAGLDPDPKAAAIAQGFPVYQGGIECFDGQCNLFDVITLSHVIEHVHDPIDTLRRCHALLKPGGHLWLETPNIDAFGHARFGRHWLHLDPPRHLILFNHSSLEAALRRAGFQRGRTRPRPDPCLATFEASRHLALDLPYSSIRQLPKDLRKAVSRAAVRAFFLPNRREFLTVTAVKWHMVR